ncbi:MAG TPA: CCA tRNA nucleotidyltransferase, partial [Verrucomicrobiae bacterium]
MHTRPEELPAKVLAELARGIVQRLRAAGFAGFWVGGCVRDFLLGREPHDFDIATDGRPEQVEALFPHTIPVGRQFGVVIVLERGQQFQVATFRAEADYRDGRRPESVSFANAEADAVRRDFTINGLFYDPLTETIHDWVGGQADLQRRRIRTIGRPEDRFAEDHLRMLRAVRFAAQLGFEIEADTLTAVQRGAEKIRLISAERVRDELVKLFRPPHAARGLRLLQESGLLEMILPELAATLTCEQSRQFHPEGTVFNHICLMLENLPGDADPLLPWAVLLHDIAKPVTATQDPGTGAIHFYGHEVVGADLAATILRRLKFPNRELERVVEAVRHHMQFMAATQMRKATLRRFMLR